MLSRFQRDALFLNRNSIKWTPTICFYLHIICSRVLFWYWMNCTLYQCLVVPCYILIIFLQAVYNANKFARLVRKRNRLQNWLDYNQLKFERNPEKRPRRKVDALLGWNKTSQISMAHAMQNVLLIVSCVPPKQNCFLGLWGEKNDSIDFYKHQIKELDKKVSCSYLQPNLEKQLSL